MGNTWIEAVQASKAVDFIGFVEIDEQVAAEKARKYSLDASQIFPSLEAALNVLQPDGLINVTPPPVHEPIALVALDAGIPVLSEQPLAHTQASARAIVAAANRTGVLHMVAQDYRYRVPTQTLKQVLSAAPFGPVGSISVTFRKGSIMTGYHQALDYPLLVDMSIHHFDLMRFFLEREPVSVIGRSWSPPYSWHNGHACATLSLEFDGGITVNYLGSWAATSGHTTWIGEWIIECERGAILLHDDQVYTQARSKEKTDYGSFTAYTFEDTKLVPPVTLPLLRQHYLLDEFYRAITDGTSPATTCQDNLRSIGAIFSAIEASETGSRAPIIAGVE